MDDDPDGLEVLEYLIRQEGAIVRTAKNAREALELLLRWTPDVMLFDISMPDMDGVELLAMIRGVARLHDGPVVAVTAHAFESDKERSVAAGFAAHVSKPFDAEALIGVIGSLVTERRAEETSPSVLVRRFRPATRGWRAKSEDGASAGFRGSSGGGIPRVPLDQEQTPRIRPRLGEATRLSCARPRLASEPVRSRSLSQRPSDTGAERKVSTVFR
jgi:CheY-like chemotaxis protein